MSPELLSSLSTLLVGVLGAITALVLALKRRATEEELPALRKRVEELEQDLSVTRRDVVALDLHVFTLERIIASNGMEPPARPEALQAAVRRLRPKGITS